MWLETSEKRGCSTGSEKGHKTFPDPLFLPAGKRTIPRSASLQPNHLFRTVLFSKSDLLRLQAFPAGWAFLPIEKMKQKIYRGTHGVAGPFQQQYLQTCYNNDLYLNSNVPTIPDKPQCTVIFKKLPGVPGNSENDKDNLAPLFPYLFADCKHSDSLPVFSFLKACKAKRRAQQYVSSTCYHFWYANSLLDSCIGFPRGTMVHTLAVSQRTAPVSL